MGVQEQLNKEQSEMRIKQLNEYENYRLFQMRELQMLNFQITARNSTRPPSFSTPDTLQASPIEKSAAPATSNAGLQRYPIKQLLPVSIAFPSNQSQAPRVSSHSASHSATPPQRPSSGNVHIDRRTILPPPPPPSSSRSSERTDSNDRKRQRKSQSKYSQSHDERQFWRTSSRSEREDSLRTYHSDSRKRDRPRSSSDNSDREAERKRRDVRSKRLKSQRSPPRSQAPSPRPRSHSRAVPTKIELPKAKNDNVPPTVAASSTLSKGKAVAAPSKNQRQSSVAVETHDGRAQVVRRYMAGKKPKEYLGSPVDFDDALYNSREAGNIRWVHTYWEGESSLCFMNRETQTILGRVSDIEPVIREHFVRSSSNSDM
jgi:hypothetical protein